RSGRPRSRGARSAPPGHRRPSRRRASARATGTGRAMRRRAAVPAPCERRRWKWSRGRRRRTGARLPRNAPRRRARNPRRHTTGSGQPWYTGTPMNHIVIMAGGGGTRLWPLSRRRRPKQFLSLLPGGETLIGATVRRVNATRLVPPERTLVVTAATQVDEV